MLKICRLHTPDYAVNSITQVLALLCQTQFAHVEDDQLLFGGQ